MYIRYKKIFVYFFGYLQISIFNFFIIIKLFDQVPSKAFIRKLMGNQNSNLNNDIFIEQIKQPDPMIWKRYYQCCANMSIKNISKNIDSDQVTCGICYCIYKCPRIMKCKHKFCSDCINDWGKSNQVKCPFCRIQLKKSKGNFGRADKKTSNIIQKLRLQCRNCCWNGTHRQFITQFTNSPYIEEQNEVLIIEKKQEEGNHQQKAICEQKQQKIQAKVSEYKESQQKNIFINQNKQKQAEQILEQQNYEQIDQGLIQRCLS